MIETISFHLNDKPVSLKVDGGRMLLWVLRTELNLTGTKYGCGEGLCGSCTVLVNDEPVLSCQSPVRGIQGKHVTTIEGVSKDGPLHPLQEAFMAQDALQCGYCTPGMILTAYGLLKKNPRSSRVEILKGMENNLCRCGAHQRIVAAIELAAQKMKGGQSS